jgi:hypothetical protein
MICPECGLDQKKHGLLLKVAVAANDLVVAGKMEDNEDGVVYAVDKLIVELNELYDKFAEDAHEVS